MHAINWAQLVEYANSTTHQNLIDGWYRRFTEVPSLAKQKKKGRCKRRTGDEWGLFIAFLGRDWPYLCYGQCFYHNKAQRRAATDRSRHRSPLFLKIQWQIQWIYKEKRKMTLKIENMKIFENWKKIFLYHVLRYPHTKN